MSDLGQFTPFPNGCARVAIIAQLRVGATFAYDYYPRIIPLRHLRCLAVFPRRKNCPPNFLGKFLPIEGFGEVLRLDVLLPQDPCLSVLFRCDSSDRN